MKKFFPLIILVLLLAGCTDHKTDTAVTETKIDSVKAESPLIKVQTASTFRDTIFGLEPFDSIPDLDPSCSDTYYADSAMMPHYLFFSSFIDNVARINVHGKMITMVHDSTVGPTVGDLYVKSFEGEGYKATFVLHTVQQYDEGSFNNGTLEIVHEGRKETIRIIGESGC